MFAWFVRLFWRVFGRRRQPTESVRRPFAPPPGSGHRRGFTQPPLAMVVARNRRRNRVAALARAANR